MFIQGFKAMFSKMLIESKDLFHFLIPHIFTWYNLPISFIVMGTHGHGNLTDVMMENFCATLGKRRHSFDIFPANAHKFHIIKIRYF